MKKVLILGAGKIGCLIATLLHQSKRYEVILADREFHHEAQELLHHYPEITSLTLHLKDQSLDTTLSNYSLDAIVSSLPFYLNQHVARYCYDKKIHYFDLTEDTKTTNYIKNLALDAESAFVPQCGLAPGFIGLAANSLMAEFDEIENVSLRVGALPQFSHNRLFYSLTWSTDGLINEYINPCYAIDQGKKVLLPALENYELLSLQGELYEAFNTSGGLGNLAEIHAGKVKQMNYKTLRYVGHQEKMKFLLDDLKLKENPQLLKEIFEHALPRTYQDVVVIYIAVSGFSHNTFIEKSYLKKIYPKIIGYREWSAIQVSTASGICAVLDLYFTHKSSLTGFIPQEQFSLAEFLNNDFGQVYENG